MRTAFDPKRGGWLTATTDRLPKHDVVFGSPINDPMGGLPIGDGDIGSLLWMSEDKIHIHVNKSDLWDDDTQNDELYCSVEEDNLTCLRHGGEITIGFNTPCFDMFYQDDFEARLVLKEATATLRSHTPFSDMRVQCFASSASHTTVLHYCGEFEDPEEPEIRLSRFGSRNFWRWYGWIEANMEKGLDGTSSYVDGDRLYITQQLNGTYFCIGLKLNTESAFEAKVLNGHSCCIRLKAASRHEFDLFYTIALGTDVSQALKNCSKALDDASNEGAEAIHEQHKKEWAAFWNRSFIAIPDDYVENIYYLSLYYSNCECRGTYPPHFTQGLWGFRHDFLPWTHYFFYNMQHMYGPLNAAGHGELAENYFRMRRKGLDIAYRYAEKEKGLKGAFYHDVTDRYGRVYVSDGDNFTPAAQIAMAMWHYYRYTGDEAFLNDIAFPVMQGAAELYLGMLKKGNDGLYHIEGTTAYEANPPTRDTITDLAMIRVLFPIMRDLAVGEQRARYEEVLAHLPEFPTSKLDKEDDWDGEVFSFGIGAGQQPLANGQILAMGYDENGMPIRHNYGRPNSAKSCYGFPDVEMAPIYPSGLIGIGQKQSDVYKMLYDQILLHSDAECMQWCMMPLYLVRMGMAEWLPDYLRKTLSRWQPYPNGMNADGPNAINHIHKRTDMIVTLDRQSLHKAYIETFPFRYYDFETTPIVAQAASEALLQSHEGILRICPATRAQDEVAFRLFAEGGFCVQAEISSKGYVITVDSQRGEECRMILPGYADAEVLHLYRIKNGEFIEMQPKWIELETEYALDLTDALSDGLALLSSVEIEQLEVCGWQPSDPNKDMKQCGEARLGSPVLPHTFSKAN